MTTVGSGKYTYQLVEDWAKFPDGMSFGWPASVATDSKDKCTCSSGTSSRLSWSSTATAST